MLNKEVKWKPDKRNSQKRYLPNVFNLILIKHQWPIIMSSASKTKYTPPTDYIMKMCYYEIVIMKLISGWWQMPSITPVTPPITNDGMKALPTFIGCRKTNTSSPQCKEPSWIFWIPVGICCNRHCWPTEKISISNWDQVPTVNIWCVPYQ